MVRFVAHCHILLGTESWRTCLISSFPASMGSRESGITVRRRRREYHMAGKLSEYRTFPAITGKRSLARPHFRLQTMQRQKLSVGTSIKDREIRRTTLLLTCTSCTPFSSLSTHITPLSSGGWIPDSTFTQAVNSSSLSVTITS